MKKTSRLVIREDVRLKRNIQALASKMDITSTDFIRMVIRNGAKFYSKKLGVPYLANYDVSYQVIDSAIERGKSNDPVEIDDDEMNKLENEVKKLK